MQVSPMGFVVFAAVLLVGYLSRGPLIIGFIASLAFGATALVTLSSLGGSSPLLYAFFSMLMITAVAARRKIWRDLGDVFGRIRAIWVLCAIMIYAPAGALLFPRLFAGQTSVFVQSAERHGIVESSLAPTSGNVTQPAYFVLGGLTAIALCVLLSRKERLDQIRHGFLVWCCLHTAMGLIDFLGKMGGAGDLLGPIRTANYAMLTNVEQAGFVRIAGAYSEASAFGSASLICLPFAYVYWRKTKNALARWLAIVMLFLLLLSTSSAGYVGLMVLSFGALLSILRSMMTDRLERDDLLIVVLVVASVFVVLAISLYNEAFFDPVTDLIDHTLISKGTSGSAQERTYWNIKSLEAFVDTNGMGIGFGSSRASSWPIAVVSQLGVVGALLMATLVAVIARGLGGLRPYVDPETEAIVAGVRASAIGSLVANSLVSGTPDPGMIFFLALAVIASCRVHARANAKATADARHCARPGLGSVEIQDSQGAGVLIQAPKREQ